MPSALKITIGETYGRLTILAELSERRSDGRRRVECRCTCGTIIAVIFKDVCRGNTRSCGCLRRETRQTATRTHGQRRSREYQIWCGMKQRCTNPREKVFSYYGGRGITICSQWLNSFEQFLTDMGPCPPKLTLERRDNSKGYAPDNCYWATREQQANNKRNNRLLTFAGRTLSVSAWARECGLDPECLRRRVFKAHWPVEKALTTPAMHRARWG